MRVRGEGLGVVLFVILLNVLSAMAGVALATWVVVTVLRAMNVIPG